MADLKAPGCDSLPAEFLHDNWSSIGQEVFSVVSEFFCTGRFDAEINLTVISLIHKIASPSKVSEFHPISPCNVFYKIISKILTNRLKGILACYYFCQPKCFHTKETYYRQCLGDI
jgi:hypothetical protein